jgi:hypothetical protein
MSNVAASRRTNRRLTARRACHLIVRYRTGKEWHPATALDLSRNGCRIRCGEELVRGGPVRLAFEAPLRDGAQALSVEAPGTVIWTRLEGLSYQAGVHFADDDSAELQDILNAVG